MVSIYAMLKRSQLRWAGHVCHLSDKCLPETLLCDELEAGKCSHEGQNKCYKEMLKVSLKCWGISHDTWEETVYVCATQCSMIITGVTAYEEHRANEAIQKCQQQKNKVGNTSMSNLPQALQYPQCDRVYVAWIGLIGHLHTHTTSWPTGDLKAWVIFDTERMSIIRSM